MSWFRKKKNEEPAPAAEPVKSWCERTGKHLYEDLPWYIENYYNESQHKSEFELHELYLCHLCHQVKNITLFSGWLPARNYREHSQNVEEVEREYSAYIKPKAVVKDMLNDMIYLDKQRLSIWKEIHPAGTIEI